MNLTRGDPGSNKGTDVFTPVVYCELYYVTDSLSSFSRSFLQTERRGSLKSFASNLLERTTSFKHNLGSSYPGGGIAKRGHHQVGTRINQISKCPTRLSQNSAQRAQL